MILEDIPGFLKELGDDFSFVDSEYEIMNFELGKVCCLSVFFI